MQFFTEENLRNEGFDGYKFKATGTTTFEKFFESLVSDQHAKQPIFPGRGSNQPPNQIKDEFFAILQEKAYDGGPKSYFFETPQMKNITNQTFEFVLLNADGLNSRRADSGPFMEHFRKAQSSWNILGNKAAAAAVQFRSLGGDARLVAPTPLNKECNNYNDLASFMRTAEGSQINGFWEKVAKVALENARKNEDFRWMSTAGQGVAWLHLRFDQRPKYYTYQPYSSGRPNTMGKAAGGSRSHSALNEQPLITLGNEQPSQQNLYPSLSGNEHEVFTYHVSCKSDQWSGEDPFENMTGFCILSKTDFNGDKMSNWEENGVRCQPGYIVFIKTRNLKKPGVAHLDSSYYGRAYRYIFGKQPDKSMEIIEFSYYFGEWKNTSKSEFFQMFKKALKKWNHSGGRCQTFTSDELGSGCRL